MLAENLTSPRLRDLQNMLEFEKLVEFGAFLSGQRSLPVLREVVQKRGAEAPQMAGNSQQTPAWFRLR